MTQGTYCGGSAPYKCKCQSSQYFNSFGSKCKNLLSINETCIQADSCKTGNCKGLSYKCQCLPTEIFNITTHQCKTLIAPQNCISSTIKTTTTTLTTITTTKTTLTTPISCDVSCIHYNNHCYLYYLTELTWTDAEAFCRSKTGYLLKMDDQNEFNFVTDYIKNNLGSHNFWIGASANSRNNFNWVVDSSALNANSPWWGSSEPNGIRCVQVKDNFHVEQSCTSNTDRSICEMH